MSEQLYDFFGEIFQRYFRSAIGAYPRMGGALVERLLTLTDDVPDRLAQTRGAAMAWGKAETPNARITSELFVITQHGLMYAAGLNESRRALYYLATPPALFDPFVDQVQTAELREGTVVVVDSSVRPRPRISSSDGRRAAPDTRRAPGAAGGFARVAICSPRSSWRASPRRASGDRLRLQQPVLASPGTTRRAGKMAAHPSWSLHRGLFAVSRVGLTVSGYLRGVGKAILPA